MQTADQSLFEALAANTALTSLLGGPGAALRIYPAEAPEGAVLPLLIYQLIAATPATSHAEGQGDTRLDSALFQLTALAATPLAAAAVLYQARLALEASTTLQAVLTGERSLPRAEEANAHGRSADFLIWNDPDAL